MALERERIRAIEGNRAKCQFPFNMSHDIRTPMNAIMGFTHLSLKKGLTAAQKDVSLEMIDHSGRQLRSIINDVLDMSRIENDRIGLDPIPMGLTGTLGGMRDLFSAQMEGKWIDFTVDTSGIEDAWVLCDKNRFTRVLLNLLSSASRFTPEGERVSLSGREMDRAGEYANYGNRAMDDAAVASVPIVAMTAYAFTEDIRDAEEAGMDGHIAKPIDEGVMLETMTRVLGAQGERPDPARKRQPRSMEPGCCAQPGRHGRPVAWAGWPCLLRAVQAWDLSRFCRKNVTSTEQCDTIIPVYGKWAALRRAGTPIRG